MRNLLLSMLTILALCGCDNPDEYTHPENQNKKPIVNPAEIESGATDRTGGSAVPAIAVTGQPTGNQDTSAPKTADIAITGDFDNLNVSAGVTVDVTVGSPARVSLECAEKSFNSVSVKVEGNTLNVTTPGDFNARGAKLTVMTPKLSSITTSGTALVTVNGLSGAQIDLTTSGASTVEATGSIDSLNATAAGASLIRGKTLPAKTCKVTASGNSVAEVFASDNVDANASGESVVTVWGKPAKLNKLSSGKGIVTSGKEG